MNDDELEQLLKTARGREPRPEILSAILARVKNDAGPANSPAAEASAKPVAQPALFLVPPRRPKKWVFALSAVAAVAVAALVWQLFFTERNVPLAVARGEGLRVIREGSEQALAADAILYSNDTLIAQTRADVQMNDGSSLRLDQGASLTLQRSAADVRASLKLNEGRVFLRVSKVPGRFRIHVRDAEVDVLGTVFGVSAEPAVATTCVYEGRVRVTASGGSLELGRGESGIASGGAPARTELDPAVALAWARDWTRFDERPLSEVLNWIESNSAYRFKVPSPILQQRVSVAIEREPLLRVIETLMLSSNLRYAVQGNDVTVLGEN